MQIDDLCKKYNLNKEYLKDHNFIYSKEKIVDNSHLDDREFFNYFCSNCGVLFYFVLADKSIGGVNNGYIFVTPEKIPKHEKNLVCIFGYPVIEKFKSGILLDKRRILNCNDIIIKSIIE